MPVVQADPEAEREKYAEKARLEREALLEQRRKEIAAAGLRVPQPFRPMVDAKPAPRTRANDPTPEEIERAKAEIRAEAQAAAAAAAQPVVCETCGKPCQPGRRSCAACKLAANREWAQAQKIPCPKCGELMSPKSSLCLNCSQEKQRAERPQPAPKIAAPPTSESRIAEAGQAPCANCGKPSMKWRSKCKDCHYAGVRAAIATRRAPCPQCGQPMSRKSSLCQPCWLKARRDEAMPAMAAPKPIPAPEPEMEPLPKYFCVGHNGQPCGKAVAHHGNRCRSCAAKVRSHRERFGAEKRAEAAAPPPLLFLTNADALVAPISRIQEELKRLGDEQAELDRRRGALERRSEALAKLLAAAELLETTGG